MTPTTTDGVLRALGVNIASARREQRLTQAELARASGVNLATLQDVERARYNTTIVTLVRIAEGLGVSLDGLVRRSAIVA